MTQRVVVLGAGTMGSGIAAQLANVGFHVSLVDVSESAAREGFERARSIRPPHLMLAEFATRIRFGGLDESRDLIPSADWVCEAIVEKPEAKRALYEQIEPWLAPGAFITTNTSGLQIGLLAEGRSDSFRRRFVGTHFFNPPRYLKLLELIPTPETDPAMLDSLTRFLEEKVGRRVVRAKDTPGFIANRFGMWSMFHATHVAEKLYLSIEEVDAITGPFLGRPKSGTFRLNDLVGLDIMRDIAENLRERCPEDDQIGVLRHPRSLDELLSRGWIGAKAGQGYYRKEGRDLLALDLQSHLYREQHPVDLPSLRDLGTLPLGERISRALQGRDEVAEYLRLYLRPTLDYSAALRSEISHTAQDFDRVMKWGFGWQMGPFEMRDAIGLDEVKTYANGLVLAEGDSRVPVVDEIEYRPLASFPVVEDRGLVRVRDLGDGVLAFSLLTKQGTINLAALADLEAFLGTLGPDQALVFAGEGPNFSMGFDLNFFRERLEEEDLDGIDAGLAVLQRVGERLEQFNVVAAVIGYCLGAGLELALSCARIVAHPEAQIGLPEARVGLIPGGRGATLMRLNNQSNAKNLAEVVATLTEGTIADNGEHARLLGYLRPTDSVVVHPDRVLFEAKQIALQKPLFVRPEWISIVGPLAGMIDREQDELKKRHQMSDYDEMIGDRLKAIFAKCHSYSESLLKERSQFRDLCQHARTRARIAHMLDNGKPLRN
ncbi:MAG: 3-hydroxyacyl-CoA dehydrogenase NAD-binding domain-containing protein [Fimbriimonas sp.]